MSPKVQQFAIVICAFFGSVLCQSVSRCVTPDALPGSCVPLNACPFVRGLRDRAPKPLSPENQRLLLDYRCDSRSKLPKVCCPESADHWNLGLLPSDCGETEGDRLLGGKKTGIFEFPFMALLSYMDDGQRKFECAGTIINNRTILTAAHCITDLGRRTLVGVRVGEHDYATNEDCEWTRPGRRRCAPSVQDFSIEKIISHASYVGASTAGLYQMQNDIGLLRLSKAIDLTQDNASPVCLPTTRQLQEDELDQKEDLMVLPGWGVTKTGAAEGSSKLLKITVARVSNQICGQKYERSIADGISDRQICAGGERNVGNCNADSGGPLLLRRSIANVTRTVQFGILTGGTKTCGLENLPGVYIRVGSYMNWILDHLEP